MVVNFFKLETNGDLTFGCSACKHCRPNEGFAELADSCTRSELPNLARLARASSFRFAKCARAGDYCDFERSGGKIISFFAGKCGEAGRHFEPK